MSDGKTTTKFDAFKSLHLAIPEKDGEPLDLRDLLDHDKKQVKVGD